MAVWKAYVSLGALAAVSIPIADRYGARDILYFSVVVSSIVAAWWGVASRKPQASGAWGCFVLAIVLQFSGALIQANTDVSGLFGSGLSPADAFLLSGHLSMMAALWQFASQLHRDFPRHGFFQGCILAISMMLVGWQFLFLPTIIAHGFSLDKPQVIRMLYPCLSFVEIGMLLWVWTSSQAYKSGAFALLASAIVLFATGESVFHGTSYSLQVPHNFNLVLWLLAYVAMGGVALHPDMAELATPRFSQEGRHLKAVLHLLAPLVLLLPVSLLIIYSSALHPATVGILIGFFVVMVLGWYELRMSIKNIVRTNQLLETQNNTDYLTGIPNRKHIEHVMDTSAYRLDRRNGLLLIDIDGFKAINNSLGFHTGDLIIKAVAARFHAESARHGHHFSRVDGDEFALLMLNAENEQAIEAQAWQMHRLLDDPVVVNGAAVKVSCSIGVSIAAAADDLGFASMLKESERALGWAREKLSQVEIYDKHKDVVEDQSWVLAEFRDALASRQIVVYYQPKVHTTTRRVLGVESLVRWHHPQRGLVMPEAFVRKIEATDLAHQLFMFVLQDAATQWNIWCDQGVVIGVALNVVARDIMHFDLVGEIERVLAEHQMPARYLEIEITESSALTDPVRVKHVLTVLMELGVKISIDDYGTGYSSLLYLQRLPLHYLKIDQQFIRQMRHDPSSATIVHSTMELAKSLNVQVVAEGVEDDLVYQRLKAMGCYGVQGFLFSKAVCSTSVVGVVRSIESATIGHAELQPN